MHWRDIWHSVRMHCSRHVRGIVRPDRWDAISPQRLGRSLRLVQMASSLSAGRPRQQC